MKRFLFGLLALLAPLFVVANQSQIPQSVTESEGGVADVNFVLAETPNAMVAVDEDDDVPFIKVEKMPSFGGGDMLTFRNWVMSKLRYPEIAQKNGVKGRVLVSFVIERDGTLTNIKVLMTPDSSLSDEVIRVLKSSPKWEPGMQRGEAVRVKYTMPVDFSFQ